MTDLRKLASEARDTLRRRLRGVPDPGGIDFGDLRRTRPISDAFGTDRGLPIDRHYIERFLGAHAPDVRGRVLEIGEDLYTRRFGAQWVSQNDLVGVYGLATTDNVRRIGVRCVQVDATAHWIGDPVDRGAAGGSTGTAYTRTCPRDYAIAGFKGRTSLEAVKQLDFECRALDPSGSLVGAGQFLGPFGSTAGAVKGPFRCGSNHPGHALAGRSSVKINTISLQCRRTPA